LKSTKVTSSGQRADQLARDPDEYFAQVRAEAMRAAIEDVEARRTRRPGWQHHGVTARMLRLIGLDGPSAQRAQRG
jgi:hypothetical protein